MPSLCRRYAAVSSCRLSVGSSFLVTHGYCCVGATRHIAPTRMGSWIRSAGITQQEARRNESPLDWHVDRLHSGHLPALLAARLDVGERPAHCQCRVFPNVHCRWNRGRDGRRARDRISPLVEVVTSLAHLCRDCVARVFCWRQFWLFIHPTTAGQEGRTALKSFAFPHPQFQ